MPDIDWSQIIFCVRPSAAVFSQRRRHFFQLAAAFCPLYISGIWDIMEMRTGVINWCWKNIILHRKKTVYRYHQNKDSSGSLLFFEYGSQPVTAEPETAPFFAGKIPVWVKHGSKAKSERFSDKRKSPKTAVFSHSWGFIWYECS